MIIQDNIRYCRFLALPDMDEERLERLKSASILIVGCGALGSVAAMYLAGSGAENLTIADYDTLDLSNLQRQVFYKSEDLGYPKIFCLKNRIKGLNPRVNVSVIDKIITKDVLENILKDIDYIVEASDNPATKYLISKIGESNKVPYTIGGISDYTGQVMSWKPGTTPYHEIFQNGEESGFIPCSMGGVMGPLPGVIGSFQAIETIKSICGIGKLLTDKLLCLDVRDWMIDIVNL